MVLFIIKESITVKNAEVMKYINPNDKVLLIQDGVLVLNNNKSKIIEEFKKEKIEVFALKEDLKLRGIKNNTNAKLINYDGFVELIENNKVFS